MHDSNNGGYYNPQAPSNGGSAPAGSASGYGGGGAGATYSHGSGGGNGSQGLIVLRHSA